MRIDGLRLAWVVMGIALVGGGAAYAQTDVSASVYGTTTQDANGNGSTAHQSDAGGGMVELRHISNPLVGYEVTYSFNRANQLDSTTNSVCGLVCGPQPPVAIPANEHEVSADWVASLKVLNFRPFALAGVGVLVFAPSGQPMNFNASTITKPAFVYGVGADWGVAPHVGLRLQYRGNLYRAPQFAYTSTGAMTVQSEVAIGVYFRL